SGQRWREPDGRLRAAPARQQVGAALRARAHVLPARGLRPHRRRHQRNPEEHHRPARPGASSRVTVKVLRIATSNDSHHALPLEERGWYIAAQMLSDAAGEPVETIVRSCWPTETFPPLLERWLNERDPDIVLIQVNNFWYAHDSIPLGFERKFGRAGKKLTDVGLKAGKQKWLAESRPYIAAHRTFLRVMPAATHFTIEQVASCMEEAIRRVIAHEGPVLLVRGNDDWAKHPLTGR